MNGRPLRWLHGEVKTPPMTVEARREIGFLLRQLQDGRRLGMPQSSPMPEIGARCHELRVKDIGAEWRIMYRVDADAVLVLDVFSKKTRATPSDVIEKCRRRLGAYERDNT
jgi:phage-related protein